VGRLVLLFTLVPLVELWLLLAIGERIGFWPTVGLTVGTAFLGASLAKREGRRVLVQWQQAVQQMRVPEEGVLSGVLVLVGGVLLVTPGVLTDLTGILLLIPLSRRLIGDQIKKRLEHRFTAKTVMSDGFTVRVVDLAGEGPATDSARPPPEVIDTEGEEVVEDEPKRLGEGRG
jgi:UPF0716 protein FxsA